MNPNDTTAGATAPATEPVGESTHSEHYSHELAGRLENSFTYHPPKGDQEQRYTNLRNQAKALAETINNTVPNGREKSLAITKLEETVMWANKAIACGE